MYTCDSSTGCSKVLQLRNLDRSWPLYIKMTVVEVARIRSESTSFSLKNLSQAIFSDSLIYTLAKNHPYEARGILEF